MLFEQRFLSWNVLFILEVYLITNMNGKSYILLFDKQFARDYRKLDKSLQIEGDKKLKRLKENPKEIGKQLKYFPDFYELHLRMYRIYYIIRESELKY